jgi:hypothetical protein
MSLCGATPRPAGAAGRAPDRRWPYTAGSSEAPCSPRARPAGALPFWRLRNAPSRQRQRRCYSTLRASDPSSRPFFRRGLFRHFDNRRQVEAYADTLAERISRSRAGSVEICQSATAQNTDPAGVALDTRQPHSPLTWRFEEQVKRYGGRLKKTTIVALARKLLVTLWKFVTAGVIIEGAVLNAA